MSFNIIKQHGAPQKATKGRITVHRQDKFFIEDYGSFVMAAPYDDHFVYENSTPHESSYMCTCGAPAVIVPPGAKGMMVCLFHATYGVHQTSVINSKDRHKEYGRTRGIGKVRKWE